MEGPAHSASMSDSKDIISSREDGRYPEKIAHQERRRSSVADLNRNRNLDAK